MPSDGTILFITAWTHLDGTNNSRLVVDTPPFATRTPTDKRFVDFDGVLAANGVAVGSHHSGA
jgi:hypothetical protein